MQSSNKILLNDIVPKNREQLLTFKIFSNGLDSSYAGLLEDKEEFEALQKVCKTVLYLFHGLSAVERGFNADDLSTIENQPELSLKTLRLIHHDHILQKIAPNKITVIKDLRESAK